MRRRSRGVSFAMKNSIASTRSTNPSEWSRAQGLVDADGAGVGLAVNDLEQALPTGPDQG
jgi:hypothetical protein